MRAALFILAGFCAGVAIMPVPPGSTFLAPAQISAGVLGAFSLILAIVWEA